MQHVFTLPFFSHWTIAISLADDLVQRLTIEANNELSDNPPQHLINAVQAYVDGTTDALDLPHKLHATPFQARVLHALKTVPRGHVISYQSLSDSLNSHPRAIGQALKRNPLPLIFPCHRVKAKKHIGGFMGELAGDKIDLKQAIIYLESVKIRA